MIKKITALSLTVIMLIILFTACSEFPVNEYDEKELGMHIFNIKETDGYIVQNGSTEYTAVYSSSAPSIEVMALSELVEIFKEATSIEINTVPDTEIAYSEGSKLLSVGSNEAAAAAGITTDKAVLGPDGVRVVTKGNSVFMLGAGEYGTLYSVYEFLHQAFDFEMYYADSYFLKTGVRELKLMDYDITDVPDIEYRSANYGFLSSSFTDYHGSKYNYRLRMPKAYDYEFININGKTIHNSFRYLPKDKFQNEHPLWYSDNGLQLCYTAHGDDAEYQAMLAQTAESLKTGLITYPKKSVVTLTQEDEPGGGCTCSKCKAMLSEYGAESASIIIFVNDLNRIIRKWFAGDGSAYARDLTIIFFAYDYTVDAPVKKLSSGRYEPSGPAVVLDEGVAVWWAPINMKYTESVYSAANKQSAETAVKWNALTNRLFVWLYSTNFYSYLLPYDSFNSMRDNYRFIKQNNAVYIFDQAQFNQTGAGTAWSVLKAYLNAKLAWNVNNDYDRLIRDFFDVYFMDASQTMLELFNNYRVYTAINNLKSGYSTAGDLLSSKLKDSYWPMNIVEGWLSLTDRAIEEISLYKTANPVLYDKLYNHIALERLSYIYILVQLYSGSISQSRVDALKSEFIQTARKNAISRVGQSSLMEDFLSTW